MAEALPSFGRLRWLCRRGTKELDKLLGGVLEEDYHDLDSELQHAFVDLLNCQDPDIYDWLMGAAVPSKGNLKMIIRQMQKKYKLYPPG